MKLNRTYLLIAISFLALLIVLIIQINWILESAKTKEELFNEKANMVLSRTTEAVYTDTLMRMNMEYGLTQEDVSKIDSLLSFYMNFYEVNIGYYFEVKPSKSNVQKKPGFTNMILPMQAESTYTQCIKEDNGEKGSELKLVFPDKEHFILAEMRIPFFSSIILILVVGFLFWKTTVSLMKEKEISEYTTDFLNNMTHEFKTPLTNIALASKMMVKETNLKQEDKIKHYSDIILEENEKLRQQVEQVLSMTALERGEIPLQKNELDFHQLIHDSLKCIYVQIENKNGSIDLKLNAEKHLIYGDKNHLTNALCNLIDNAIKYSKEKPELSIVTFNKDGKFIVSVSDKGIGIKKEYLDKVFDKFFRIPTGNVHNVKGFGLGLAYIKKIIELHEGSTYVESEEGEGANFILNLPYA